MLALLDLDGTLADYDLAMRLSMKDLAGPNDPEFTSFPTEPWPDYIKRRKRLIAMQPGFWSTLPPIKSGFEIVEDLKSLGFDLMVLTKGPSSKPQAWAEKVEWCRYYLPGVPVTITEDKSIMYARVLVDDYPLYYNSWLLNRPRGVAVVPAQPWNDGQVVYPNNTFRYTQDKRQQLRLILEAVKERKPGEAINIVDILSRPTAS